MGTKTVLVAIALAATLTPLDAAAEGPRTLVVGPDGYGSIQAAVDAAAPGDTVLIMPGSYQEAVFVTTPSIVVKGVARESVILDGGRVPGMDNAIFVTADGVSVESLTVQNYNSNGVVFSRVTGFRMYDLHAKDNEAYGLYAIHSTKGDISYSSGEGHGDSAIYIGETVRCDCDVHHNKGWNNMLGYSGTANSYVRIWENEFFGNRAGILMSVLPNEMGLEDDGTFYGTQVGSEIYRNYIHDNNDHTRGVGIFETVHPPVGEGIVIAGGWNNHVYENILENNALWGVGVYWLTTPPRGNVIEDNVISGGRYGIWWDEWGEDNCFEDNLASDVATTSSPDPLPTCDSLVAPIPCPEDLRDWAACRGSDVRAPSALKEADLAWRALTDADPDQSLIP